ncbi:3-oxoacyl-[acyl-carrier-protein] reductase FabG [Aquisphaera giovannonii]|uniref:3-oxoacyl-[acyl-carrier-protein] reductase FabG n=1 Tax=Aquisphaera giovannonii TaxID=406548 RepID=A0A5B9VX76_9BACT|nr:SDR family NAD(P)-dependent oxidoreductase [Aquisphaera giovannonii]QEH32385.1 3-oxoacyl-[acyl-carrier-protein] reductase FabG [Aquisphaera giovannonii]
MADSNAATVALVTGAGREQGLGFEVCRQLARGGATVILTARDRGKAERAAAKLAGDGTVHGMALDVDDDASVLAAAEDVAQRFGSLTALIHNAVGGFDVRTPTADATIADAKAAMETTLFGAWRLIRAFAPLLVRSGRGRIVNVSSEAGSFGSAKGLGSEEYAQAIATYAVAKAALNALTLKFAAALKGQGVLVNAVCPGFTATHPGLAEMGARPVPEGAAGVVWAATLPDDGPTGGFFRDGRRLPW